MRARHRHFNYGSADGALALDSRFINASNGSSVSSWTDRSAGGRTATTPSGRGDPTLSTRQIGGSDTVQFASASNQALSTNNKNLFKNVAGATVIVVYKATTNSSQTSMFADLTSSKGFSRVAMFLTPAQLAVARNNTSGSATSVSGGSPATDAHIATLVANFSANPLENFLDGASLGTANFSPTGNTPNNDSADNTTIGAFINDVGFTQHYNGHLGVIAAYQRAVSSSLRKRLEHAAAYSFKISCN